MGEVKEEECLDSILHSQKKNPPASSNSKKASPPKKAPTGGVKKEETQQHQDDDFVGPTSKLSKFKKENEDTDDDVPISKRTNDPKKGLSKDKKKKKKGEAKRKEKAKKEPPITPGKDGKKREKKVYELPGQKRDPPEERDPLRIFYETLYEQIPSSEMAQFWMMESGLLAKDVARKIFEKKQKKIPQKPSSPKKAVLASKKPNSASAKKKVATSPGPSTKYKMTNSKMGSTPSKRRKKADDGDGDGDGDDDDDDFVVTKKAKKGSS